MMATFQSLDVARFFAETPHKIWAQIQTPEFLAQIAIIVLGGALALWLSRILHRDIRRYAETKLPAAWVPGFVRISAYVAFPVVWLAILWSGAIGGIVIDSNLPLPVLDAAIDLVFAWICIRLLSFTVKSHSVSVVISIAAWSIAALSILDLYRPIVNWLRRVPVYEAKDTHITLLGAIHALIVLAVLLWLTRLLYGFLQRRITQTQSLTPSLQALLNQLLKIILPTLAVVIALQAVGVNLTTLTVAFGAIGLGVGLGLQKVVSNFVSGISLIAGKVIKPGDILKYKDIHGWVTNMGARYVTLRTLGGIEHLIPNDYFIENGVENWSYSDAAVGLNFTVGISYGDDVHLALDLCRAAAASVPRVLADPGPVANLKEFGDSAVVLEVGFWIDDPRGGTGNVKSAVMLAIWDRFKAAGITMPFPQREVRLVNPAP